MKLKSKVTSALAIVVFASFSFFPQKACAMKQPPEPSLADFMPREEEPSTSEEWVHVHLSIGKRSNTSLQGKAASEKTSVPPGSAEQLIGTSSLPVNPTLPKQQSIPLRPLRSTGSAQSVTARSRSASGTGGQAGPGRQLGRGSSNSSGPGGSGPSQRALASANSSSLRWSRASILGSQGLRNLANKFGDCCGCSTIVAARREGFFDAPTAREKLKLWNEAVAKYVPDEHKPLPLARNLSENESKIFDSSQPLRVFANKDEERIKKHVQQLAKSEAESLQPVTPTGRGKKTTVDLTTGTLYDPNKIIFEVIEAFKFMTEYAHKTNSVDNKGHKLALVTLGAPGHPETIEGLVLSDMSPHHLSTGDPQSSTHADLYMRKGKVKKWACVGAISNHTGLAQDLINEAKLERDATYKR